MIHEKYSPYKNLKKKKKPQPVCVSLTVFCSPPPNQGEADRLATVSVNTMKTPVGSSAQTQTEYLAC